MHTNISLQQLRYIIEVAECGSINAASQQLYVSQPTLSTTIKDTEQELGISIFNRTNRGITLTNEGTEFIGYARQILQQFDLFEARYSNSNSAAKGRLCVSSQHYAFCVHAFVDLAEECDEEEYNFSLRETRTAEVIEDVKEFRSEIGVLYLSDFNRRCLPRRSPMRALRSRRCSKHAPMFSWVPTIRFPRVPASSPKTWSRTRATRSSRAATTPSSSLKSR